MHLYDALQCARGQQTKDWNCETVISFSYVLLQKALIYIIYVMILHIQITYFSYGIVKLIGFKKLRLIVVFPINSVAQA